jgi:hypothetical protein
MCRHEHTEANYGTKQTGTVVRQGDTKLAENNDRYTKL